MNILFLSAWFPHPADNGSKIRVKQLIKALAPDHRVSLVSFAFDSADPETATELYHLCESIDVVSCNPFSRSLLSTRLRYLSLTPIVNRAIPSMTQVVQRKLKKTQYDLVIASTSVMAVYALIAQRSVVKILEEHNSMVRWRKDAYLKQEALKEKTKHWLGLQKIRAYESRLFRRFDLCTMVSELDRQSSLRQLWGFQGPVVVVLNGVDCVRNQIGISQVKAKTLVFNGALTYSANLDAMRYFSAQVLESIQKELPGVVLYITGSSEGVDTSFIPKNGSIVLTGFVEDVRSIISSAWACVVPIREGGGTRLKVLEALALGTPVVSTPKGVEGLEVIPDRHVLVAEGPDEFATQVIRLLQDRSLRDRLSNNGRRLVEERYDWYQIGELFAELCFKTVERARANG